VPRRSSGGTGGGRRSRDGCPGCRTHGRRQGTPPTASPLVTPETGRSRRRSGQLAPTAATPSPSAWQPAHPPDRMRTHRRQSRR
jgi:hypothetical protein